MVKDLIRFCEYCNGLVPNNRNGNSKYCCKECSDKYKAKVAKERNLERALNIVVIKNDEILHEVFLLHNSNDVVSAKELTARGFNWSICSGEATANNLNAKTFIRYGYILFNNLKVKIWQL